MVISPTAAARAQSRCMLSIGLAAALFCGLLPIGGLAAAAPARPVSPSVTTVATPVFFDLVVDDVRGRVYGSDKSGGNVYVLDATTGATIVTVSVGATTGPAGMDISPDGTHLAVAESNNAEIALIDLTTTTPSLTPNRMIPQGTSGPNQPWDVRYGRTGRVYSVGNPGSGGFDYVHAFDTTTLLEVGRSGAIVRAAPRLAITGDRNSLFVMESAFSPQSLTKFDISTDLPGSPALAPFGSAVGTTVAVKPDGSAVFLSSGQVWVPQLTHLLGSFPMGSNVVYSAANNRVFESGGNQVSEVDGSAFPYPVIGVAATTGTAGALRANAAGTKVYVSTSSSFQIFDVAIDFAGPTVPASTQPYAQVVLDVSRGLLYASDTGAGKVRVFQTSDLVDIADIDVGATGRPMGMDLSPDASHLAVALNGAGQLVLINLATRILDGHLYPLGATGPIVPFDVRYGRTGRLYSSGSPGSSGFDYIHVFDTATFAEAGRSTAIVRGDPHLAISPDGNSLYADEDFSPPSLYRFNVTTDAPPAPTQSSGTPVYGELAVRSDGSAVYVSGGQAWSADLQTSFGNLGAAGPNLAYAGTVGTDRLFVSQNSTMAEMSAASPYSSIGIWTVPAIAGPLKADLAAGFAYVSTASGIVKVNLASPPPSAPQIGTAVAGVGSATVSWSPPTFVAGGLTKYTITSSGGAFLDVGPTITSAVIAGLTSVAHTFTVTATSATGAGPASAPSNSVTPLPGGTYHPLVPARILDTRFAIGVPVRPAGQLGAGQSLDLQVLGQGGVLPSGVSGVVLNVTVTATNAASFLSVWPQGSPRPVVSNLNWVPGKTVANLVEVAVNPATGRVSFFNSGGNTDVIVDVQGYVGDNTDSYTKAGLFNPLPPKRDLDTRIGVGAPQARLGPGATLNLTVTGVNGVPATGVSAVILNVIAVIPSTAGFLSVWPAGATRPTASNLNFLPNQVVPNRVMVGVGTGGSNAGKVSIYNPSGTVDVVADVNGWFTDATSTAGGSAFVGVLPIRIFDTRASVGGPIPAGFYLSLGPSSPPPNPLAALVLNVTAVAPTSDGFLTLYPDSGTTDHTPPTASDLNFVAGDVVPNLTVVKLGPNSRFDTFNPSGSTDVVYDEDGYYGTLAPAPPLVVAPRQQTVHDTAAATAFSTEALISTSAGAEPRQRAEWRP